MRRHLLGLVLTLGIITGCSTVETGILSGTPGNSGKTVASSAPQVNNTSTTKKVSSSDNSVTFHIKIDKSVLSSKKDIEARLYNDEQMKISEKTSNCSVSYDAVTKKETYKCADGVEYQKPTPEIFKFKFDEIKDDITIKSTSVKAGQRFLLNLSGLSSDNCNSASSSITKASASIQENIEGLQWASTMMACLN